MTRKSESGSVRRFGRKDRKDRLPPATPLFPQPDTAAEPPALPAADPPEPDFAALLPDTDSEALESLSALPPDAVRPLKITPPEQRYPPLPPDKPRPQKTPAVQKSSSATAATPHRSQRRGRNLLYNLVALLAFTGTIAAIVVYGIIWNEPQSYLNPFPPDVRYVFVTATPGSAPADGLTPTPETAIITPTFEIVATVPALFPFVMRDGSVIYMANANARGCEWASIAGSVTDIEGRALNGYRVRVTGADLDETVFSGAVLTFGAGGYEMPLGNAPQAGEYTVQLFSPQGAPLSEPYTVTTRTGCQENVAILNLVQSR